MQTGMKQLAWFINALLIAIMLLSACTDPTDIGADLLEGDKAEVGFTDTLSVVATTIKTDTVLTYFPVFQASEAFRRYPCGEMDDPIFGQTKSQIFAQLSLTEILPDLQAAAKIDSIVLVLPYDSLGLYGNYKQNFGFSIHRLSEDISDNLSYYSNVSISSEPALLGNVQFRPLLDSVTIYDYAEGRDTLKVPPQMRIKLPLSLAQEFVQLDTSYYRSDSAFISYFKGIHIKPTTVNQGMISFNLTDARAGIFLYYEKTDTTKGQFQWDFNPFRVRAMRFDHDYNGATAERYIDNTRLGDSLVFVQGLSGVTTKLEIPHVKNLKGLVVNKAELEVRVAELPGDDIDVFTPIPQIMLLTPEDDGDLVMIDDIALLIRQGTTVLNDAYDGQPKDGKPGEPKVYKMNISTHFQGIIDGRKPNSLYMTLFNRAEAPARVSLYGAKHPQYSIKLKVAFTRL